jgi:RNA-directed DNA polymerase
VSTSTSQVNSKPYDIPKREVWEAYRQVRANKGAPGIDGQTIEDFEKDLKGNLYKIWNRMSSGSYFPPPVRAVEIPKSGGGVRVLGVPTIADRIAQTVVATRLAGRAEPRFHPDSYGYRPARSGLDAVAVTRERCWTKNWVLDLDIQAFFDSVNHDLLMKAVAANTTDPWVLLYVQRWLHAPLAHPNGTLVARDRGTPQGSAVSPVLANLFLHYAFDEWMSRQYPGILFARYVDDIVVHAATRRQAEELRASIEDRLGHVGLRLHPHKTKIVYCRDDRRPGNHENVSFTFLGYEFRPRLTKAARGNLFYSFLPGVSKAALKAMGTTVRRWRLHRQTGATLSELARWMNPIIRGWMNYYGRYRRSAMYPLLTRINTYLVRWARRKYKGLTRSHSKTKLWWDQLIQRYPNGFAHWPWLPSYHLTG